MGIEDTPAELPGRFSLAQNYPNPFNPTTVIRYQLSVVSEVALSVYDLQGRKVRTLVSERQAAGSYQVTFNTEGLSSGVYFYRLEAGGMHAVRKMVLLQYVSYDPNYGSYDNIFVCIKMTQLTSWMMLNELATDCHG